MPGNLGFALLGLLARRPSTGYDLARRLERPVGYFWTARHSQIYPELARLEEGGLVRHEVVDGAGPKPTKRYAVTAVGLAALAEWVASPLQAQPVRDLETLRVWSLWAAEPAAARALVSSIRERRAAALEDYRRQRDELVGQAGVDDPGSPVFASHATLEAGVRGAQAAVEWCDWLLGRLD